MNTNITEDTENGSVLYDVFDKLIENRILFIYGYVSDEVASDIIGALIYLNKINNEEKITIYINSEHGNIESVFAIYDMMQVIKTPIETISTGCVFGESLLLASGGTKGLRFGTKNSAFKFSQPFWESPNIMDMSSNKIKFEHSKSEFKRFISELSKCIGKNKEDLVKDSGNVLYLSANQAKKYGIIDSVLG